MKNVKQIIVNADDFGRHRLMNAAVEEGLHAGCLRSATIMPGGAAFADAVRIAKEHPELGVGIHLTMVNGNPVLPPEQIPSLVTPEGLFWPEHTTFVKKYFLGQIKMRELKMELTAQLRKVQDTGIKISHVDSHQHMHTLPGIIDFVLQLAAEAGIKAIRIPGTPIKAEEAELNSVGQLIGRAGLATLAKMAALKAKNKGFVMPDHFAGLVAGGAVDAATLRHICLSMPEGTTEVMMHPGVDNKTLSKETQWEHDYEAELHAIVSPEVMLVLQERKIKIGNFNSLV